MCVCASMTVLFRDLKILQGTGKLCCLSDGMTHSCRCQVQVIASLSCQSGHSLHDLDLYWSPKTLSSETSSSWTMISSSSS